MLRNLEGACLSRAPRFQAGPVARGSGDGGAARADRSPMRDCVQAFVRRVRTAVGERTARNKCYERSDAKHWVGWRPEGGPADGLPGGPVCASGQRPPNQVTVSVGMAPRMKVASFEK